MKTVVRDAIPEWRYQAEAVARLHKLEEDGLAFTCAGDMNRAKRNRRQQMEAKLTGLTAGEPDIRIYLCRGRLLSIEAKTPTGRRSKDQKDRHKRLVELGFEVLTLAAVTPLEFADLVEAEVRARLVSD